MNPGPTPVIVIRRSRAQVLRRGALLLVLVVSAVVFEFSALLAVAARKSSNYIVLPPDITWGVMEGRYAIAIPNEAAGRYPYQAWYDFLENECIAGFGLKFRSRGLPPVYMAVTMIAVPCWFVALASGIVMVWCARRLGLRFVVRHRREARGFEPLVNPEPPAVNSRPPSGRTAG